MIKLLRVISLLSAMLLSFSLSAAIDTYQFATLEQEEQYRDLTQQLRCPKCQNNSIADSNAIIATDMRNKVYELMQAGYSKPQVINYMVDRYGNFVTYEPPVTPATLILWLGPLLLVVGGGIFILYRPRRRQAAPPVAITQQERERLAQLLDDNDRKSS